MRLLAFLCPIALLSAVLCTPARLAADTVLSIQAPSSVAKGSPFSVDVNIGGVSDLYASQLDLNFNPAVLAATGVVEGSFLDGGDPHKTFFLPGAIDNVGGSVAFNADTLLGSVPGITGGGTLLVFDFTALAPGDGALSVANEILQDPTGAILPANAQGGSVIVTGAVTTAEPGGLILFASALALLGITRLLHKLRDWSTNRDRTADLHRLYH